MKKVFVSGCYDIIHAGHIQFFEDAKALGDHLTVSFANAEVLEMAKHRKPSLPDDHKKYILKSFSCIDEVVSSSDLDPVFDFKSYVLQNKPDIIAVTEDDRNAPKKKEFCEQNNIQFVILPKRNSLDNKVSTTSILTSIKNVHELPLRVDFAGGWLDVPKFSRPKGYIVNCAITPKVSLKNWPYEKGAGLGGSAAYALLQIKSGVKSETSAGVGWQDPAIISETGLCVWRSGKKPVLDVKVNPDWLDGKMLIVWTNKDHFAPNMTDMKRDYKKIEQAGIIGREAVYKKSLTKLAKAIKLSYEVQIKEGMKPLPNIKNALAKKYLGAGHGGYTLYLFPSKAMRNQAGKKTPKSLNIEPYLQAHE